MHLRRDAVRSAQIYVHILYIEIFNSWLVFIGWLY